MYSNNSQNSKNSNNSHRRKKKEFKKKVRNDMEQIRESVEYRNSNIASTRKYNLSNQNNNNNFNNNVINFDDAETYN